MSADSDATCSSCLAFSSTSRLRSFTPRHHTWTHGTPRAQVKPQVVSEEAQASEGMVDGIRMKYDLVNELPNEIGFSRERRIDIGWTMPNFLQTLHRQFGVGETEKIAEFQHIGK